MCNFLKNILLHLAIIFNMTLNKPIFTKSKIIIFNKIDENH